MGTDDRAWSLDNERGAHEVEVEGFYLDKTPVTNRVYLEFVEDGGYQNKELWEPEGWEWIREEGTSMPKHWYQKEPHDWWTQRFGFDEPLSMDAPVMHVSWFEADAYARWAGKRLPSGRRQPLGTRRRRPRGSIRGATNRPHQAEAGRTWTSSLSDRRRLGRTRRVRAPTVLWA
jgi:formylglycine-generating enzyme required for sulfatase activity